MIVCIDVDYRRTEAVAACLEFQHFEDAAAHATHIARIPDVAEYVPGQFYKRELPCILAVLPRVASALDTVVIDGHVWLQHQTDPGLGAHLHEHLGGQIPVIGVAKKPYRDGAAAHPLLRGQSAKPLFITAAGIPLPQALRSIASMHGDHRIPTLLRAVDRLCRTA